jgi:hypothetical protein
MKLLYLFMIACFNFVLPVSAETSAEKISPLKVLGLYLGQPANEAVDEMWDRSFDCGIEVETIDCWRSGIEKSNVFVGDVSIDLNPLGTGSAEVSALRISCRATQTCHLSMQELITLIEGSGIVSQQNDVRDLSSISAYVWASDENMLTVIKELVGTTYMIKITENTLPKPTLN